MARRRDIEALRAPTIVRPAPAIDESSGRLSVARSLEDLSGTFDRVARVTGKEVGKQVELEDIRRGTFAGRAAGASDTTQLADGTIVPVANLRDETTVGSLAFNKAIVDTTNNRFSVTLRERMADLERNNVGAPAEFKAQSEKFFEGLKANIAPQSQELFANKHSALQAAGVERQTTIHVARVADEQRGTNLRSLQELFAETDRAAQDLTSQNRALAGAASATLKDARQDLIDILDQETPTGLPLYTDSAKAKQLIEFEQRVMRFGAMGAFNRAPDKQAFMDGWVEDQRKSAKPGVFDLDQVNAVAADMRAQIRRDNTQTVTARREANRAAREVTAVLQSGSEAADFDETRAELMALGEADAVIKLDEAREDLGFMRDFAQMPPSEQIGHIDTMEAAALGDVGITLRDQRRFDAMRSQHARQVKLLATDPLDYAAAVGVVPQVTPLVNFNAEELSARAAQVDAVSVHFGVPVPLLREAEVDALVDTIGSADPEGLVTLLGGFTSLPPQRQKALAAEIAPKSPEIGRAIQFAGLENGRDNATLLLRGYQFGLTPESKLLKPSVFQMRIAIENEFGNIGAENPDVFASFAAATQSIYIGLAASKGVTVVDEDLLAQAAKLAAGGMRSGDGIVGGTMEINSRKTLPFAIGATEEDFESLLNSLTNLDLQIYSDDGGAPAFANGEPLTPEMITSGFGSIANIRGLFVSDPFFFEPVSQGKYLLRTPAGTYVQTARGPYIIDLGRAWEEGRAQGAPSQPPELPPSSSRLRREPGLFELESPAIGGRSSIQKLQEESQRAEAQLERRTEDIRKERVGEILDILASDERLTVFSQRSLLDEMVDLVGHRKRPSPGKGGPSQAFSDAINIWSGELFSKAAKFAGRKVARDFKRRGFSIDAAGRFIRRRHPETTEEERRKLLER